jgi:hypothetical protein
MIKVGPYVGSRKGDSPEEGFLRIRQEDVKQGKIRVDLFVT